MTDSHQEEPLPSRDILEKKANERIDAIIEKLKQMTDLIIQLKQLSSDMMLTLIDLRTEKDTIPIFY